MSTRAKGRITVPVLVSVLLSACTSSHQAPDAKQRLERFTRPAVVTILDGCRGSYFYPSGSSFIPSGKLSVGSVGSGYFVSSNGYIITNAHVTRYANLKDNGIAKCKGALLEKFAKKLAPKVGKKHQDVESILKKNPNAFEADFETVRWVILPNQSKRDPLKFQVTKAGDPIDRDVSVLKVEGIDNAPVLLLGDSDKVQNTDSILVFGYPNDSNIPGVMSSDSAFKPSVTSGSVSNIQDLDSGAPVLQITASVSRGNSGGPVINSNGEVIGMVTFRKAGSEGSGISYAIPAKTIKEVLGEATSAAKNEQGAADELYRKGLDNYWRGNYTDAINQFNQVKGKFRRHSEIDDLILDSEGKRPKSPPIWLFLAIAATTAAIPALGFILYRRGPVPAGDGMVGSVLDRMTGIWQPTPKLQTKGQTILDNHSKTRVMGSGQPFLELETRLSPLPLQFYLDQDVHHLGRDSEWSDFEIPEHGWEVISRRHAVLRREGASYRIFDGDGKPSANGIWVDGKRIDPVKGFLLTNGTQLQFGQNSQTQVVLTYFNPTGKAVPQPTYVE